MRQMPELKPGKQSTLRMLMIYLRNAVQKSMEILPNNCVHIILFDAEFVNLACLSYF